METNREAEMYQRGERLGVVLETVSKQYLLEVKHFKNSRVLKTLNQTAESLKR